jgi:hypothetical protein
MTKKVIGYIGVDAGMCYLGDPCYIVGSDSRLGNGLTWEKFLDRYIPEKDYPVWKICDMGPGSLGIVVGTGYGDGQYPVTATFKDGRVMSVTINFGGLSARR